MRCDDAAAAAAVDTLECVLEAHRTVPYAQLSWAPIFLLTAAAALAKKESSEKM